MMLRMASLSLTRRPLIVSLELAGITTLIVMMYRFPLFLTAGCGTPFTIA